MLQVINNEVQFTNNKPHHSTPKQTQRELVRSFNTVLSTMTPTQRAKVQRETEALWILINTSF